MPRHEIAPIILPDPRTRIITECIEDALDHDRLKVLDYFRAGLELVSSLRWNRISYCDNGCGIDMEAIIKGFEPYAEEKIEQNAREFIEDWDRV